jgi:hypothetical protein
MNIKKRSGESVPYDVDKIHKIVNWAVDNIKGVTASDIEINANLQKKEGMTTAEIHNVLIDSAVNLISLLMLVCASYVISILSRIDLKLKFLKLLSLRI